MMSFYARALLLLRRPPCLNVHGAARTTQYVATRTTRRACRVVNRDVTQWNLDLWLQAVRPRTKSQL